MECLDSWVSIICRAVWLVLNLKYRKARRVLWCVYLMHTWLPQAETHYVQLFSTRRFQKQRTICWTFSGRGKNNCFQTPPVFPNLSLSLSSLSSLSLSSLSLSLSLISLSHFLTFSSLFLLVLFASIYVTDIFLSAVVHSAHTHARTHARTHAHTLTHTHYLRLLSMLVINRLSSAWMQAQNTKKSCNNHVYCSFYI